MKNTKAPPKVNIFEFYLESFIPETSPLIDLSPETNKTVAADLVLHYGETSVVVEIKRSTTLSNFVPTKLLPEFNNIANGVERIVESAAQISWLANEEPSLFHHDLEQLLQISPKEFLLDEHTDWNDKFASARSIFQEFDYWDLANLPFNSGYYEYLRNFFIAVRDTKHALTVFSTHLRLWLARKFGGLPLKKSIKQSIAKNLEGYIPYLTWARPPTLITPIFFGRSELANIRVL